MSPLVIVIFIVLAIFGSVYMLKPSPRQQRLAALRLEAIKLGLQVKLDTFKPNSKQTGVRDEIVATRYQRFIPEAKSQVLRWCIVRQGGWEQEGLVEGWSWHDQAQPPDLNRLAELLTQVGEDVQMIEVYDNRTSLMTIESKANTAEMINDWLDAAQQL
jgi:hypothetical protein